jgi:hypothetical protein
MKGHLLNRTPPVRVTSLALAALVVAAPGAFAQEVHKCTQGGHVTYQATPCPGEDKVLAIPAGPDAADVEAARQRAAAQKARTVPPAAATGPAAAASAPGAASAPRRGSSYPADSRA